MAGYIGSKAVSVNTTSATISDDLTVGDDLTVTDDATVGGTLGVTGVLTTTAATVSNGGGQFNGAINVGVDDTGYDVKFFGATASAYMQWDASADDLILGGAAKMGIGTSSPSQKLHVSSSSAIVGLLESTGSSAARLYFDNTGMTTAGDTQIWAQSNDLAFNTSGSEAMRISNGNLLVGTTDTSLHSSSTESGARLYDGGIVTAGAGTVAYFNRNGAGGDGTIIDFRKDGSAVGSIGVNNSDNFTVQGNSAHSGIEFGTNAIYPHKNSANVDNTIDLGEGSLRWKDLYLSGGIQFDARSNKLDDYEEGTWTPVLSDGTNTDATYSFQVGKYTKVGNKVHVQGFVRVTALGALSGALRINGLPFTTETTAANYPSMVAGAGADLAITAGSSMSGWASNGQTHIILQIWDGAAGVSVFTAAMLSADGSFVFSMEYVTA